MPGRTDVQVRERWCNVLDPGLTKAPWGEAEDAALRAAIAALTPAGGGRVPWAAVAARVPPRTDAQCTLRWRKLQKMDAADGEPLQIEAAEGGGSGAAPAAAAAPGRKRAAAKPRAKKAKPLLAESDDEAEAAEAAQADAAGEAAAPVADEAPPAQPPPPKRARRARGS